MKPVLLVMAAGIGSRYGGVKQLDRFGPSGEKIIDYTLFDAARSGFGEVLFVIRRDIERDFMESVAEPWKGRIPMSFVFQELDALPPGFRVPAERVKPWGTGHAILMGREMIRGPFAVVNADDFYGREGIAAVAAHLSGTGGSGAGAYCLMGYRLHRTLSEHGTVSRGVAAMDEAGFLTSLVETHHISKGDGGVFRRDAEGRLHSMDPDTLVSMNLWGFTPSYFTHLERDFREFLETRGDDGKAEFYLTTVVDRLIRTGEEKVRVLSTQGQWFGVTYREDRPMVERRIRERVAAGEYPENVWE